MSLNLAQRITVLNDALDRAGLDFAFGGAIAPESLAVFKAMFNQKIGSISRR